MSRFIIAEFHNHENIVSRSMLGCQTNQRNKAEADRMREEENPFN